MMKRVSMGNFAGTRRMGPGAALATVLMGAQAMAAPAAPQNILPPALFDTPPPSNTAPPTITPSPVIPSSTPPALTPALVEQPVANWTVSDAAALLDVINNITSEGLIPADYQPDALRAAIDQGAGAALDQQASRSFDWLAEDLRDGRTPVSARIQWYLVDPDQERMPTSQLLATATMNHNVATVLAGLDPTYPDYALLKQALADTLPTDTARRNALRINMDRWRWLPQDLGEIYLYVNVPEFQVRLMRGDRTVRTYRAIVGKPGRTATPQLSAQVQAVVFNPTWTVPQSIIEHDGLAEKLAAHPRAGYKMTKSANGSVTIVQQPGDNNSLGRMKIDMTNPYAIYLHDTPAKRLFNANVRAFSHGCIRTDRAVELGMTMAMLGANMNVDQAIKLSTTLKYSRVPMVKTFPAYIAYFTVGRDVDGNLANFNDIYGRDAAVLASFKAPRALHTTQRVNEQQGNVADDPL